MSVFRNRNQNDQDQGNQQGGQRGRGQQGQADQGDESQVAMPRTRTRGGQRGSNDQSDPRQAVKQRIQAAGQRGQQGQGGQLEAGQQAAEVPQAWEEFLEQLEPFFQEAGDSVRVQDRAGWVKIENAQTGHKLYFNKGVTGVTRVESSLPVDAVKGAEEPGFYNGRISSIIPPNVQSVGEAIRAISQVQDRLSPPRRRTRDIG